jgi:pentatricopeptide repeat protein
MRAAECSAKRAILQLGKRGDWNRALEVWLEMQMAQVEPSRSCINALLLVFENAGRSKQVGCLSPCRERHSPPPLPKLIK